MRTGVVQIRSASEVSTSVSAIVLIPKPLNFSFILEMNGIAAIQGVRVCSLSNIRFDKEDVQASGVAVSATPDTVENYLK